LENISRVLKRPMNQLVHEAVKDYVRRRSGEVERNLELTLASLRCSFRHSVPRAYLQQLSFLNGRDLYVGACNTDSLSISNYPLLRAPTCCKRGK
jgi:hypothetical protein